MEIKRYSLEPECALERMNGEMKEHPDGEYYSRADLIAAGVLVPVPDGEMKSFQLACDTHDEYVLHADKLGRIDNLQQGIDMLGTNQYLELRPFERVTSVRLVRLEDVG